MKDGDDYVQVRSRGACRKELTSVCILKVQAFLIDRMTLIFSGRQIKKIKLSLIKKLMGGEVSGIKVQSSVVVI